MLDTSKNHEHIEILQVNLLGWFKESKRDLPFRQTKDPYFIWVSEIMAQQTQIDTLIPFYQRFIDKFPTIFCLALASEDEVIKAWEGLGYYSRARNLHQAARIIVSDYDGFMPETLAELIKLPGIGPYTGAAIASIAFNQKVSAVDGNVLRVISRYANSFADIGEAKTRKRMTTWLDSILPEAAGDFNEALMELGALICTPQSPQCQICPISSGCQSHAAGTTGVVPAACFLSVARIPGSYQGCGPFRLPKWWAAMARISKKSSEPFSPSLMNQYLLAAAATFFPMLSGR